MSICMLTVGFKVESCYREFVVFIAKRLNKIGYVISVVCTGDSNMSVVLGTDLWGLYADTVF